MRQFIYFVTIYFVISSCSVTHNIPKNQTPNENLSANSYKVFVDQNGDFYPDDWQNKYGKHPKNAAGRKGAYSLNTLALRQNLTDDLNMFRNETLGEITAKFNKVDRIFILIHGYNNSEDAANLGFETIKNKINFQSNDGVIEFYWDGLVADGPIESFDIWFNATGYSQLAGERALRPILNLFSNKSVILISHSRGASVLLSGLSDPPYNKKFADETLEFHNVKVHNQPELADNNNKLDVIMLAPALGQVDFRTPEYYTSDSTSFRSFSHQVKNLHISVNEDDKILKKYAKAISSRFNPTDLGYNVEVFNLLKKSYPKMSMTDFKGLNSHSLIDYANNPKFIEILEKFEIEAN